MLSSLHSRVDTVRRVARRVVWLHAWGWVIATLLSAALAAMLLDYLVRPGDVVVRSLFSLAVIAVALWAARRWLLPAWRYRPSLLETAQRIELRWPRLSGRLSSGIEFLSQTDSDAIAGSTALRRRVIAEAEGAAAGLEFRDAVTTRPQQRALLASGAVALVLIVIAVSSPVTAAVGAGRLLVPWSSLAWPRWNHLQFADAPAQLARGADIELAVIDERDHPLPESVLVQIEFDEGPPLREEMKLLDGRLVQRLENVSSSFRYRASGGDDDTMAWQRLEVVEPLNITALTVTIHPPAYTGIPWEATGGVFTLLEGSRLALAGKVDQPLAAAVVQREGTNEKVTLAIAADGQAFSLAVNAKSPWQPNKSGTYLLHLTSVAGVTTSEAFRWDIRLTADAVPTVAITSPTDGGFATPTALLPVVGSAKDDLALASIDLRFLRPGLSDEQAEKVRLWQSATNPLSAHRSSKTSSSKKTRVTGGQSQSFEGEWDLQTVFGIQPGDVLTWFVEATDYRPQSGQTSAARLTIISPEEMQERLIQRQAAAISQLAEALASQRETRAHVASLAVQWQEIGRWRDRDRDLLHSTELRQRQVQTLVGRSATGAATILANILTDIHANRLELPEMAAQSEEILVVLDQLEAQQFLAATTAIADLLRAARQDDADNKSTASELVELGQQQDAIAATLEEVLGKLAQWDSFQRIRRDLAEIRDDERTLTTATQQLQAEVVVSGDPDAQQQADARQVGSQQSELARRFERLVERLGELSQNDEVEQAVAQKAVAVAEAAGKLAIASKMRSAARAADEVKLGQSLQTQQEVDRALAELLDALAGRLDADDEPALQELRDLAASLDTLEREQGNLADELEQPGEPELARLADEQQKLADNTDELAGKLEKSKAADAAQSSGEAAESMKKGAAAGNKNEAAGAAREAQKKLQEAKRKVNEQIAQRQADLLREQMARLEQHIQGLIVRQEAINREADRLLALRRSQQYQLSKAQVTSVTDLAIEQEALGVDTRSLGESGQLPAAFALQLGWTAGDMSSAATRLRDAQLDEAVLNHQDSALDRLRMIAAALEPAEPSSDENEDPPEPPMGDDPPMPPPDDAPAPDLHDLAEVKLLRAMQAAINEKTSEIEAGRSPQGTIAPAAEQQLTLLADEQGRVADLALKLVQSLNSRKPAKGSDAVEPPAVSDEELLRKLDEALLPGEESENKP